MAITKATMIIMVNMVITINMVTIINIMGMGMVMVILFKEST
jgi:hypothetical protein